MILLNSQSKKKKKEGSKLDNVEVKQLLSQCTFTHLPANDEDGSEDDDADEVGGGDYDLTHLLLFSQSLQNSLRILRSCSINMLLNHRQSIPIQVLPNYEIVHLSITEDRWAPLAGAETSPLAHGEHPPSPALAASFTLSNVNST